MFKLKHNFSPPIMSTVFPLSNNPYNLRNSNLLKLGNIRTVYNGLETVTFRGPDIWAQIPDNIKQSSTVDEFKTKLKFLKVINCKCRICKNFVPYLGFI